MKNTSPALLLLLTVAVVCCCTSTVVLGGSYSVIPGTGLFQDDTSPNGDTYLGHGVNVVHKGPGLRNLTMNDVNFIKSMGFNVVRFGILWTNLQPENRQEFNHSYLLAAKQQVDLFYQNGIRVFIDMHQDCFSGRFKCGAGYDGVPLWASTPPATPEYYMGGNKSFPLPGQKPNFVNPPNPAYGPWGQSSGAIAKEGCAFSQWAQCYPTYALGAATQMFYHNFNGTADAFADAWAQVATVFLNHPGVIGYEILNEPFLGRVPLNINEFDPITNPENWDLWFGDNADKKNLAPFYNRIQAKIRAVDPETPIFFEPASGGAFLESDIGFANGGPGGKSWDVKGKNVFSYHAYCPIIQSDGIHFPKNISGIINLIRKDVCEDFSFMELTNRGNQVAAKGFGGFLTEFGAIPYSAIAADYMRSMLVELDRIRHSWTFWEIDLLEGAPQYIRNALLRSYPMKVPGRVIQFRTSNSTVNGTVNTTTFEVEYVLSPKISPSTTTTPTAELYLDSQAFPFGSGYTVEAFPPCCVHVSTAASAQVNVVTVTHDVSKLPPQSVISIKFISN